MNDKCCEITCGADACSICGACRTEHNEDPVDNCPKNPIHRTTVNCQRIKELKALLEQHRWIPISKKPKDAGYYLTTDGTWYGRMYFDVCWYFGDRVTRFTNLLTHWKPIILPEQAPKGG